MEEAAKLITAIAALVSALVWPLAVIGLLVVFRSEIRLVAGKVPGMIDRVQSLKLGALEADLQQLAQQVPPDSQDAGRVTVEQVRLAASVEVQARDIDMTALLRQMDRLAIEYDTLRRTMRGSSKRTTEMTKILVQMRGLARAVSDSIEAYKSSGSPGSRLAAIAMMQMEPSKADLAWLKDRFFFDAPFVFYHAALALQNVANNAGQGQFGHLLEFANEAREKVASFDGGGDQNTLEVLDAILSTRLATT